ncbi:MAG: oligosaccharide flippase family protein [Solirubrobacterales bacterium]
MKLPKLLTGGNLAKSSAQTVSATAVMLAFNLITGVMVARLLGSEGRGEIAAIVTLGQTLGWAATMGCFQAVVFHNSREPDNAARSIGTWMALSLPLGIVGIVAGQLLVGPLFAEQSETTVNLARLWLLMVPLMPLSEALSGALVADRDFAAMNFFKLLQSALPVVIYLVLWLGGIFTLEAVLITHVAVVVVYLALLLVRALRRHGVERPRLSLAKRELWFGARAQASNIGTQLSARLDLLIMPAFLVASQVGLYAVAVSISSMVVTLAGSLAMIALPVAARADGRSDGRIAQVLHATFIVGAVLAAGITLLAPYLLELVYSNEFRDATTALRFLAPGAVLLAMSNIMISGLYGQDRPATAGLTQLPGVVLTVVGLVLFLRSGGIAAAALISTLTYACSFMIAAVVYQRRAELTWVQLLDFRPTLAVAVGRLRQRIEGWRETPEGIGG